MAIMYRARQDCAVHFDPQCPRAKVELKPVKLADLGSVKQWCKACTPERLWDGPKTRHIRCTVCSHDRPRPCPHNGGICVMVEVNGFSMGKPVVYLSRQWRWPERVLGAPLAAVPVQP